MPRAKKQLSPSKRKTAERKCDTIDAAFPSRKPGRHEVGAGAGAGIRERLTGLCSSISRPPGHILFQGAKTVLSDAPHSAKVTRGLRGSLECAAAVVDAPIRLAKGAQPALAKSEARPKKSINAPKSKKKGAPPASEEATPSAPRRVRRLPVESIVLDDTTFRVGESAYVVLSDDALDGLRCGLVLRRMKGSFSRRGVGLETYLSCLHTESAVKMRRRRAPCATRWKGAARRCSSVGAACAGSTSVAWTRR